MAQQHDLRYSELMLSRLLTKQSDSMLMKHSTQMLHRYLANFLSHWSNPNFSITFPLMLAFVITMHDT